MNGYLPEPHPIQKPLAGAEHVMLRLHGDHLIANEIIPAGRYEGQDREFEWQWCGIVEGAPDSTAAWPDCSEGPLYRAEWFMAMDRTVTAETWSQNSPRDWAEMFRRIDAHEAKS